MKKMWKVFRLEPSVCGISNKGIEYGNSSFNLDLHYGQSDNQSFEDCEKLIQATLEDYKNRGVGKDDAFVILPVYTFQKD